MKQDQIVRLLQSKDKDVIDITHWYIRANKRQTYESIITMLDMIVEINTQIQEGKKDIDILANKDSKGFDRLIIWMKLLPELNKNVDEMISTLDEDEILKIEDHKKQKRNERNKAIAI